MSLSCSSFPIPSYRPILPLVFILIASCKCGEEPKPIGSLHVTGLHNIPSIHLFHIYISLKAGRPLYNTQVVFEKNVIVILFYLKLNIYGINNVERGKFYIIHRRRNLYPRLKSWKRLFVLYANISSFPVSPAVSASTVLSHRL